ncbi:hypothetical protein Bbelb_096270 [Branchiostoma belcheri]|nr:hypothetical protein Bbelb_096270 [Branchiostoma belcheri]
MPSKAAARAGANIMRSAERDIGGVDGSIRLVSAELARALRSFCSRIVCAKLYYSPSTECPGEALRTAPSISVLGDLTGRRPRVARARWRPAPKDFRRRPGN